MRRARCHVHARAAGVTRELVSSVIVSPATIGMRPARPGWLWRLAAAIVLVCALAGAGHSASPARAQGTGGEGEPPTSQEQAAAEATTRAVEADVEAIAGAFALLGRRVDAGDWQGADSAFNAALDALDEHRGRLEAVAPEVAPRVFGEVEVLLVDLDAALSAEDRPGVLAIASLAEDLVRGILPGSAEVADDSSPAVPASVGALREWRGMLERIELLASAGRWRDMRNQAIELIDLIDATERTVRSSAPAAVADVDRAKVFALRLRAAALDQSIAEAEAVGERFGEAIDRLLTAAGAEQQPGSPVTGRASGPPGGARFTASRVPAMIGDRAQVMVSAEAIPQIGMGAMHLRVRWSPTALRLLEARSELPSATVERDDDAGQLEIRLPSAPVGPGGDFQVAALEFEVLGAEVGPRDYLPSDEVEAFDNMIESAVAQVRLGDLPKAAAEMSSVYTGYINGLSGADGLLVLLGGPGSAPAMAVERRLLTALELVSRPEPAPSDEIVVALAQLRRDLETAYSLYRSGLRTADGVPIVVDALEALDTTGEPIALAESGRGEVLVARGTPAVARPTAPLGSPARESVARPGATPQGEAGDVTPPGGLGLVTPPPLAELEAGYDGGASLPMEAGGPRQPGALLVVLALASAVAAGVAFLTSRADRRSGDAG